MKDYSSYSITLILSWFLILQHSNRLVFSRIVKQAGREDRIMNHLLRPTAYSRDDPPRLDSPTEVQIGMYVIRFYQLNEKDMDFKLSIYLRQTWKDPRLIYDEDEEGDQGAVRPPTKIKLESFYWKRMWLPDTFFRNEKIANRHDVTVPNRFFTLNTTDGTVWYALKITTTLSCMMKLHKYPLDTQRCSVMIESFGYKKRIMYLSWLPKNVELDDLGTDLPQFMYEGYTEADCSRNDTVGHSGHCLEIIFQFRRNVGFFVIQAFVPSMLIVSLSWVSFWINVDAAPARVSLGLLTVLTTSSYSISINTNLPRVSYVKAIDVWMSACLLFVFAALCEYAFVNVAARVKVVQRQPLPAVALRPTAEHQANKADEITLVTLPTRATGAMPGGVAPSLPTPHHSGMFSGRGPARFVRGWRFVDGKARARRIDMVSRRCFPAAFVIFNIIYWLVYVFTEIPANSD